MMIRRTFMIDELRFLFLYRPDLTTTLEEDNLFAKYNIITTEVLHYV